MIKKIIFFLSILFAVVTASAQETTSSPYSFYGMGLLKFKGTVENQSMGGMSTFMDSIHLNLRNPASYGDLSLTTYSLGASHKETDLESELGKENTSATAIDYLAIAVPVGKVGVGFGLLPYSSVGYRLHEVNETGTSRFSGRGGLNRVYLSAGYEIVENLRIGVEANYNFGNIQNKSILFQEGIQYGTREINESNIRGFGYNFGLNYRRKFNDDYEIQASASYTPSTDLSSENSREIATIAFNTGGQEVSINTQEINVADLDLSLPSQFTLGAGIGKINSWFVGLEYGQIEASSFSNRSFTIEDARFENASMYRFGGLWVPDYTSLTSYFERITYRAGFRFEETGLIKAGEAINEFGISFGVGLPVGRWFSSANIGFEYGQRGTTNAGLVKENFYNLSISLSLNDKWFVKSKFD